MMMVDMVIFTPSSTPSPPIRNPHHHSPHWYPLPPDGSIPQESELIPRPLFSKRKRVLLQNLFALVHDVPARSPSTLRSDTATPPSPTASFQSYIWSTSSSPPTSAPSSPSSRPRSLACYSASSHAPPWASELDLLATPRRCLRRKPSPRKESLRSLRVKGSDACLQRVYDEQLDAYLSGDLFHRARWSDGLESVEEG